uniref:NADH-quinone oxidoreductase subunit NuoE n=1 Tax=Thermodesulfovibrio aggregans TaxID=86166 RepID=A0A7C4AK67_9BACT
MIENLNIESTAGDIAEILSEEEKKRAILIQVLQQIQEEMGYLPEDILKHLSKYLSIPLSEIYSIASFYKMFYFKPKGKNIVRVCLGTACYVKGAKKILQALEQEFKIKTGETTDDLTMTLERVGCIGCCGLAPVATINDEVVSEIVGGRKIQDLIIKIKEKEQ